jgi:hypothetical protein
MVGSMAMVGPVASSAPELWPGPVLSRRHGHCNAAVDVGIAYAIDRIARLQTVSLFGAGCDRNAGFTRLSGANDQLVKQKLTLRSRRYDKQSCRLRAADLRRQQVHATACTICRHRNHCGQRDQGMRSGCGRSLERSHRRRCSRRRHRRYLPTAGRAERLVGIIVSVVNVVGNAITPFVSFGTRSQRDLHASRETSIVTAA